MTKMASFCICDIMIHIYDIIDMHGNHGYNGHSFDFKKLCHKYMPDTCFGLLNTLSVAIYPPPLAGRAKTVVCIEMHHLKTNRRSNI